MGWSKKYKKSINCNNPKGFSQKAHCAGRKKENVMSSKLEELVGKRLTEEQFDEAAGKKDACYHKVKARYDVWPSAYASGALVKCRKVGAKNWGNKSKKEGVDEKVLGGKDMTSGIDKNTKITFDKRIMNKKLAGKTFVVVKKGINTFNVRPDGSGNERDTKTLDAPTLLKLVKNRTISKIVNSKGKAIHEQSVNEEKYVVYVDKDGKGRKGRKIVKSGLSQMGAKRLYNKLVKTDDYHEVGYDDHKSWNQNNIEKINEGDIESRELKLYIDNDSQLYNSRFMPIIKNLSKKMKKGNFDKKLAIKGFMYLVDAGAKKYVKDYGGNAKEMFSKKDRIAVASDLADEFEDAYKNKEYSFMEGKEKMFPSGKVDAAVKLAKRMGGNMTGAVKKIEKMAKGLSKNGRVQYALRQANESINEQQYFDPNGELRKYMDKVLKKAGIRVIKYDPMKQSFYNGTWGGFYTVASSNMTDMPGQGKVKRSSAVLPVYIDKKNQIELGVSGEGFKLGKVGSSQVLKKLKDFNKSDLQEGLGDMIGKSIGKYNKKRKKNMDALKKLKKKESVEEARGTCWVGYQQKGMKDKGGRMVPNCVKEIIEVFYEENGEGHGYTFEYVRENQLDSRTGKLDKKIRMIKSKENLDDQDKKNIEDLMKMKNRKESVNEAEYQGRKVKLGKIMQGDTKKFKVYVKNPKGNVVKVNFGQGGGAKGGTMRIRKSNPKARKNFRARHNCDNPGPRHKARYWSCRKW